MSAKTNVVETRRIIPLLADYTGRKDFKQVTVIHRDRGIHVFDRVSAAVKFAHRQREEDVVAFLVHTKAKGAVPTVVIPVWCSSACAAKGCVCA